MEIIDHQSDKWENETYTRQVNVLGAYRRFVIEGFEDVVSWPSSSIKHWEDQAIGGAAVTLTIIDGNMHSYSEQVRILGVDWDLNLSSHTEDPIREYTLRLQEV